MLGAPIFLTAYSFQIRAWLMLLGGLAAIFYGSPTNAALLPYKTYEFLLQQKATHLPNNTTKCECGYFESFLPASYSFGHSRLSVGGANAPSISFISRTDSPADYNSNVEFFSTGYAQYSYQFAVLGGRTDARIPLLAHIIIDFEASRQGTGYVDASSLIEIYHETFSGHTVVDFGAGASINGDTSSAQSSTVSFIDGWFPFTVGSYFTETVEGSVGFEVNSVLNTEAPTNITPFASFHTFIDPTIIIDPVFATVHPEYHLQSSAGVSGVPEPSAWSMLITGFGLAATISRRKWSRERLETSPPLSLA